KVPRAMEIGFLRDGPGEVADLVRAWDADETSALEQELFKQRKRIADGSRALLAKGTKKAREDVRIGNARVAQIRARLDALRRTEATDEDRRIFPGHYCHVLVSEGGQRVMRPMRYQCRPAGKPAAY